MSETAVRLLAFGGTKTIVGTTEVHFPIASSCSASEFLDDVCRRYPQLAPQRQALRLAVNGEYVDSDHRVASGDEVALIPPVAGG
ncbi:MoaD/ThiS family protein [Hydrogenophaga sp.]|uniref:MoaD/ThiS family protein n=1 Tax=Hydrogenophaga sp. TaxID=1904254 RepID=UPI00271B36FC|nr:MoaD/ThiS family protein [Hydrogenophaga sp.]MDO9438836.1 MoaD/ThiS family protein [Hydrogenophaga sp.]